MLSTKKTMWMGLLVFLATTSTSAWYGWVHRDKGPLSQTAWVYKGTDARELFDYADVVALVTVQETFPGRVVVVNEGEDKLPYQMVEFTVDQAVKGGVVAGDRYMLERAGGMDPDGIYHNIDADGGEYASGTQYLLFLKWQENNSGMFYLVNDSARYEVRGNRLIGLDPDDAVTAQFHNRRVKRTVNLLRSWND